MASGSNNTVAGNSIYENSQLGIDLGAPGVAPNHVQDPDGGANFQQNLPVLYEATTGSVVIAGLLNRLPSTIYTMHFYRCGTALDATGYGEGHQMLDSVTVTTGPNGNIEFEVTLGGSMNTGEHLIATATDPWGNTSEFAKNVQVVARSLYGDADGDGLPTRWEWPHHLDPFDPTGTNGAAGDPDHDYVSNIDEYIADTEPCDAGH